MGTKVSQWNIWEGQQQGTDARGHCHECTSQKQAWWHSCRGCSGRNMINDWELRCHNRWLHHKCLLLLKHHHNHDIHHIGSCRSRRSRQWSRNNSRSSRKSIDRLSRQIRSCRNMNTSRFIKVFGWRRTFWCYWWIVSLERRSMALSVQRMGIRDQTICEAQTLRRSSVRSQCQPVLWSM